MPQIWAARLPLPTAIGSKPFWVWAPAGAMRIRHSCGTRPHPLRRLADFA
jgi:hypothetical protein